jgi:autotransporter-associated beta strand protein
MSKHLLRLAFSLIVAFIVSTVTTHAQTFTWDGGSGTSNGWSIGDNWLSDVAPPNDGTDVLVFTGTTRLTNFTDAAWSLNSLIFGTGAGAFSFFGAQLTIGSGGISNGTTVAQVINNNILISSAQTWVARNGILTLNGNLTGSASLALNGNSSNSSTLPTIRFGGINTNYTGTITPDGGSAGLLLASPLAQTGGLIDLNAGNRNLWLTANTSSNPYTFGIGTTAPLPGSPMKVRFRGSGTAGLYLTGGHVYWDPGNGGDYTWVNESNTIDFNGSDGSTPNYFIIGNDSSSFILSGANKTFRNAGGGNSSSLAILRSALADDSGGARNLNTSLNLLILTRPAVNDSNPGTITVSGGALAVTNMNQIFSGNLNLSGGVLVLDGLSWSDFLAGRSSGNGTGANQWQLTGGGFASRGADLTISGGPTNQFNASFALGSAALDTNGQFYATGKITLVQDTTITARRTITIGATGPGLTGTDAEGIVHTISGNIIDGIVAGLGGSSTGALSFSASGPSSDSTIAEVVLRGTNYSWKGSASVSVNTGNILNSGPGGIANNNDIIVRFDGDASFPTGNISGTTTNTAYLAAQRRNTTGNRYGFMITGSTASNVVYDLPAGYKFLIGGAGTQEQPGTFGSTGGDATLQNSAIVVHSTASSQTLNLLVREGTLTFGSTNAGAVSLQSGGGISGSDSGIGGAATTITDRSGGSTLVKRGPGTLILRNVAYVLAASGTDHSFSNTWQIGQGTANVFGGALRETGTEMSNSTVSNKVTMAGGVLELGAADFTRILGTGIGQVNMAGTGGGGFSAFGGDRLVMANNNTNALSWGSGSFVASGQPLLFGSFTADSVITLTNGLNLGTSGNSTRIIRVIDNTSTNTDFARVVGVISGSSGNGLRKEGDGTLDLAGLNTYAGLTTNAAGTLLINGSLTGAGGGIFTLAGATLGGSGTTTRNVTIQNGGTLSPGNSPGIFNVGNLSLASNSNFKVEINGVTVGTDYDQANVTGTVSLDGANLVLSLGYVPSVGDEFVIINNDSTDPVGGFFFGLPDLSTFSLGGFNWEVTYVGGVDGNDVVLTVIPEPGALTLALVGLAGAALVIRRRR